MTIFRMFSTYMYVVRNEKRQAQIKIFVKKTLEIKVLTQILVTYVFHDFTFSIILGTVQGITFGTL